MILRPLRGEYAEPAPAVNSIGVEIRMIHGEDCRKRFTPGKIHEGGIREIDEAILVACHQRLHFREFRMLDCGQHNSAGTHEFPGGVHFMPIITNQMEQYGQDCF